MPKRAFLDYKRRYDPETEGYGDPGQWQQAFRARLGLDKAKETLRDRKPLAVLNFYLSEMGQEPLAKTPTWREIRSAYRKLAVRWHPDHNPGDPNCATKFRDVQAAFELLECEHDISGRN